MKASAGPGVWLWMLVIPGALCLGTAAADADRAGTAAPARLTAQGYGQIRFGEPLTAVAKLLGQSITESQRRAACTQVSFKRYPGVRFMVENGIVTRADAKLSIANAAGVRAGTTLAQFMAMHTDAEVQPHKYQDDAHYLVLNDADGRAAMIFEEVGGRLTAMRAGLQPAVGYVEGCL